MDKYEYRIRADEIKQLIAERDYAQAAEIADTIDWTRVKSVKMLCMISDLYKVNRRYEHAMEILLMAYDHRPGGKNICYSLCELALKLDRFTEAVKYFNEFKLVAPKDSGVYILQYKIYEYQDVSLEERIEVLEELKRHDYREKWVYELAYLYHRIGLGTRCAEECDDLISMLGSGKYVIKAMELKMLHQPLTPAQQEKYDHRFDAYEAETGQYAEANGTYDANGAYDAENTEPAETAQTEPYAGEAAPVYEGETIEFKPIRTVEPVRTEPEQVPPDEMDIQVKTVDVGQYNTINLQAELAEGLREVLGSEQREPLEDTITRSIVAPMMEEDDETPETPQPYGNADENSEPAAEEIESSEVFFGETGNIGNLDGVGSAVPAETEPAAMEETDVATAVPEETAAAVSDETPAAASDNTSRLDRTGEIVMRQMREEKMAESEPALAVEPPKEMAHVLAQESDGQISFVVPDNQDVEKQITGQMSIADILAEWERIKQENVEKRKEEDRQRVLQHTGPMFSEFDASVRDGLLEKLEKEEIHRAPGGVLNESDEVEELVEIIEEVPAEEPVEEAPTEETIEEAPTEETWGTEEVVEETPAEEIAEEAPVEEAIEEAPAEETIEEAPAEEVAEEAPTEEITEEAPAEESTEAPAEETPAEEPIAAADAQPADNQKKLRALTKEEQALYAPFIQSKSAREQIIKAIDGISLAAYTGNVIITGEEGMDTVSLAKNMVKELQSNDSNFSGTIAKISGRALNKKNVEDLIKGLQNGALIIQKASEMDEKTIKALCKVLQQEDLGIVIIIEDTRKQMNNFLRANEKLHGLFTVRVDVEALSNESLVAFGRKYAYEKEYSISEMGVLELHARIDEKQTIDHAVTPPEVKDMLDEAIRRANKKNLKHFFDILFFKRYDENDMIVLTEKDFA